MGKGEYNLLRPQHSGTLVGAAVLGAVVPPGRAILRPRRVLILYDVTGTARSCPSEMT